MFRHFRIVIFAAGALTSPALAWQHLVTGTPDPGRVAGIAATADDDLVAGGRFGTSAAGDDGMVVRLDAANGTEVWRRVIIGSGTGDDSVRDVAVRADGDVYAFGQVTNTGTTGDALAVRLDGATGTNVWRKMIDGGANGDDSIRAGVRLGDDLIAVGSSTRPDTMGPFAVWRFAADNGDILWNTPITGVQSAGRVVAVAAGAVYVAGHVAHDPTGTSIIIARLDATTGNIAWTVTLAGSGNVGDVVQAIAVPHATRVVIATQLVSPTTGPDVVLVGLDTADGSEQWRAAFDGDAAGSDDDRAWSLAVDGGGNVIAAMTLDRVATAEDIVVAKLTGTTGSEAWRTTLDGPESQADEARDVAVDDQGDVLLVGRSRRANVDGLTAKLDGATGAERWRRLFVGSVAGGDAVIAVAVDSAGQVAIGGFTTNGGGADEMTVARLTSATGGSFPCGNGTTEETEACDDGNTTIGDGCRVDCTAEVCGDGIVDPGETCDPGADGATACCTATCTGVPEGATCDDGNACTIGETCTAGTCTTTLPLCHDADPCTIDTCTADGCMSTSIAGVRAAACVFDRTAISARCPGALPASIAKALTHAERGLDDAGSTTGKQVRALLKKARAFAKKARKLGGKAGQKGIIGPTCADTLTTEMDDLLARLKTLLTR